MRLLGYSLLARWRGIRGIELFRGKIENLVDSWVGQELRDRGGYVWNWVGG